MNYSVATPIALSQLDHCCSMCLKELQLVHSQYACSLHLGCDSCQTKLQKGAARADEIHRDEADRAAGIMQRAEEPIPLTNNQRSAGPTTKWAAGLITSNRRICKGHQGPEVNVYIAEVQQSLPKGRRSDHIEGCSSNPQTNTREPEARSK